MLKKRVITAVWAIPLLVAAIWFNEPLPWFTIFAAVWGMLAVFEFYRMTAVSRVASLSAFGLIWTLLFVFSPHFDYGFVTPLLLTSAVVLSLIILLFRPEKEGAFTHWVWTMAGILYVGWLLSYLVALRLDAGREWVFFTIFTTFGTDTAAFFVGRAIGRHRLAPRVSPAKTWEGAIAGVFGAIAVGLVVAGVFSLPLGYGETILLSLLASLFGQLGGLALSLLKRNAGVKDSGTLIPGHGGLLDRTDSVVFAGVVVYYYYLVITAAWI
ncbi:MAG: phosphatidate cytidylyltransferase [Chloroflexi bacterium]|nr:phosphatidate cytidylyltransferase [Chloroflexota bacterium]